MFSVALLVVQLFSVLWLARRCLRAERSSQRPPSAPPPEPPLTAIPMSDDCAGAEWCFAGEGTKRVRFIVRTPQGSGAAVFVYSEDRQAIREVIGRLGVWGPRI